jgi:hypothetical protein
MPSGRSKIAREPCAVGDELEGTWSRERLEEMDLIFRLRVEAAIRHGLERAPTAAERPSPPPVMASGAGGADTNLRANWR